MNKNIKKLASVVTVASLSLTTVVASNELLSSVNAQETANTKEESKQETTNVSADVFENEAGAVIRVTANADVKNVKTNYAVDSGQNRFILLGDLKSGEVREIQVSLDGDYNYKVLPKTSVVADKVDFSSEIRGHKIKGSVTFEVEDSKVCVSKKETPKEETLKVEEPKVEIPKVEEPKVETPKVEEPKVETPKVEEPKVETPKVEEPKVETPKEETPKVETPKEETPKVETPKVETPKEETPKVETPKEETPKVETPKVETPKEETPKVETPKVETPKEETPKEETPKVETPKEETPKEETPKVETPKEETPKVETPKEETPKEETPKVETPKVETPKEETPKVETPKEETPKVETPKEETPKVETPKEETPKEETPKVNPVNAGMPTDAKWTRSQLQEWGYGMGTITGNYAVDGDLGLFNSQQAMEKAYNQGADNVDDQYLNGTMTHAQYDNTPHGYFWSKITHNGQDGYKVSLYDKDGKYNAPETPKVETPKEETPKEETPKVETPKEETPKVETPKEETPKVETPKEETPKVETPTTPEVNPVNAGMPAEAKWSRSDLQNLGYEIGTVTGNYKVDGDLGLFKSQQAMENAYNKGADNVGDLYLNDKITDAQYDNAPHGYSWTKVTYNGQDSYKVSVYDKNGKYNVPGK